MLICNLSLSLPWANTNIYLHCSLGEKRGMNKDNNVAQNVLKNVYLEITKIKTSFINIYGMVKIYRYRILKICISLESLV